MSLLWFAMAALAAIAAVGVTLPLIRRRTAGTANGTDTAPADDADATFYRRQLAEVESDAARGLLGSDEAQAARREVERRLLRLAPGTPAPSAGGSAGRLLAVVIVAAVPVMAFLVYDLLGSPTQPDLPFAERARAEAAAQADANRERAMLENALPALSRRLAENPDDRVALEMLSRVQLMLGRYGEAARTMERQQALGDTDPAMMADYAEALVGEAGGEITDAARA